MQLVGDQRDKLFRRIRLPEKHWDARIANIPDGCGHKAIVQGWCCHVEENIRHGRGLLLCGEYSRGKSAIAAICLKAALCQGTIGLWLNAGNLSSIVIEKHPFDEAESMIQRAARVPLLVLDELVILDRVGHNEQQVEKLVRARVDAAKCTILTTNNSPAEIKERFASLAAVLLEAVYPVKVDGFDFRRQIATEMVNG